MFAPVKKLTHADREGEGKIQTGRAKAKGEKVKVKKLTHADREGEGKIQTG